MNPLIQSKNTTILPVLIALTLGCFALSPQARAVCQEGCVTTQNTRLGDDALNNPASGVANTACGFEALFFNTDGDLNTGIGAFALQFNTTGVENTAIGYGVLSNNTTGQQNTASGRGALQDNTTGSKNTATGFRALENNTTGKNNTAIGVSALQGATSSNNTAVGAFALQGTGHGGNHVTGINNIALGVGAARNLSTGSNNIALGRLAGGNLTSGDNNIDIGNAGVAGEANTIRIGRQGTQTTTFIAGISGATVPSGVGVIVGSNGQLGTVVSSARFKDEIKPMDKASEAILALKPVTFRYKQKLDPDGVPQFGLVAEQVEKVNPDLVARDADGKAYTVRYEAVNAMLLNEFLKEHRTVQEQEATITQLREDFRVTVARLSERLEEQAAQIQKVSAQLELSKPAPRTVLNNP